MPAVGTPMCPERIWVSGTRLGFILLIPIRFYEYPDWLEADRGVTAHERKGVWLGLVPGGVIEAMPM